MASDDRAFSVPFCLDAVVNLRRRAVSKGAGGEPPRIVRQAMPVIRHMAAGNSGAFVGTRRLKSNATSSRGTFGLFITVYSGADGLRFNHLKNTRAGSSATIMAATTMTSEQFTTRLPSFTDSLSPAPPTEFSGFDACVFPLRANLRILQDRCNRELNVIPPEAGHFRVVLPYVFLIGLNWGNSSDVLGSVNVSAFFSVAVERYEAFGDKLVFRDWALFIPEDYFIAGLAGPLNRFLFEFPSGIPAHIAAQSAGVIGFGEPELTDSVIEILGPTPDGNVFDYGRSLEVRRTNSRHCDARNSDLRNAADLLRLFRRDVSRLSFTAQQSDARNGIPYEGMIRRLIRLIATLLPSNGSHFRTDVVKHRRTQSANRPLVITYSDVTSSIMELRLRHFELLGKDRLAGGDISGGYSVRMSTLNRAAEKLGLEVEDEITQGFDHLDVIRPVVPFRLAFDVRKLAASNLAWRARDGIWFAGDGRRLDWAQTPVRFVRFESADEIGVKARMGPSEFSDTKVRLLALPASRQILQRYLDTTLNEPLQTSTDSGISEKQYRFALRNPNATGKPHPAGSQDFGYVALMISEFGRVTRQNLKLRGWGKYEVSFLIPAIVQSRSAKDDWTDNGFGLVPACVFVDDGTAVAVRSQVQGIPTLQADFSVLSTGLARLQLEFEYGKRRSGIEIAPWNAIPTATTEFRAGESVWANLFPTDPLSTNPDGIALPLYTIKQLRDVVDPHKSTFQSLVRVPRTLRIDGAFWVGPGTVRFHDFAFLQEELGIQAHIVEMNSETSPSVAAVTYEVQALNSIWLQGAINEELADELLWRSGTLPWAPGEPGTPGGGT